MIDNHPQRHNTLNEMMVAIAVHHGAHPDHGVDCSCMDSHIQDLRRMTTVGEPTLQRRIDYVMHHAARR